MRKLTVMITEEMLQALRRVKDEWGVSQSKLVRLAVAEYLRERYGIEVTDSVEWGGYREPTSPPQESTE